METINLILVVGYIVNKGFNFYKKSMEERLVMKKNREATLVNLEKVKDNIN